MAFVLVQGSCGVRFEASIQELTKTVLAGPVGEVGGDNISPSRHQPYAR